MCSKCRVLHFTARSDCPVWGPCRWDVLAGTNYACAMSGAGAVLSPHLEAPLSMALVTFKVPLTWSVPQSFANRDF